MQDKSFDIFHEDVIYTNLCTRINIRPFMILMEQRSTAVIQNYKALPIWPLLETILNGDAILDL